MQEHLKYILKGIVSLVVFFAMYYWAQDTRQAVCCMCAILMFVGLVKGD